MSPENRDLEEFASAAARHFEPSIRDVAAELALGIARAVSVESRSLTPTTRVPEILEWIGEDASSASMAQVDWLMALDIDPAEAATLTFRDLVQRAASPRPRSGT